MGRKEQKAKDLWTKKKNDQVKGKKDFELCADCWLSSPMGGATEKRAEGSRVRSRVGHEKIDVPRERSLIPRIPKPMYNYGRS